jgi:hypothetical protein
MGWDVSVYDLVAGLAGGVIAILVALQIIFMGLANPETSDFKANKLDFTGVPRVIASVLIGLSAPALTSHLLMPPDSKFFGIYALTFFGLILMLVVAWILACLVMATPHETSWSVAWLRQRLDHAHVGLLGGAPAFFKLQRERDDEKRQARLDVFHGVPDFVVCAGTYLAPPEDLDGNEVFKFCSLCQALTYLFIEFVFPAKPTEAYRYRGSVHWKDGDTLLFCGGFDGGVAFRKRPLDKTSLGWTCAHETDHPIGYPRAFTGGKTGPFQTFEDDARLYNSAVSCGFQVRGKDQPDICHTFTVTLDSVGTPAPVDWVNTESIVAIRTLAAILAKASTTVRMDTITAEELRRELVHLVPEDGVSALSDAHISLLAKD